MHSRSVFRALAIGALVCAGVAAIGIGAYNAGLAQGIAISSQAVAGAPAGAPLVYVWPRPWGFGFFPIFPFFLFLFLFFAGRGLLWHGAWRGRWDRHDGVPPAFEEWHRRAHREPPMSAPTAGSQT
jgi:hypothetical protein